MRTNKWSATVALITLLITGSGAASTPKPKDDQTAKPASSCCEGCDCTPERERK